MGTSKKQNGHTKQLQIRKAKTLEKMEMWYTGCKKNDHLASECVMCKYSQAFGHPQKTYETRLNNLGEARMQVYLHQQIHLYQATFQGGGVARNSKG